ncbi:hypothetical protein DFJ73DRAFT_773466 [Zopfochytrium polystomum]|nr:hypothetical protein DFJ73DRAFT_773466 [Zopfochytrium polystomum]
MHLSLPSLSVLVMLAVTCVVQAKPIPQPPEAPAPWNGIDENAAYRGRDRGSGVAVPKWDENDDKTADRGRNRVVAVSHQTSPVKEHHSIEENVQKHKDRDGRAMARFDENSSHAQHKKKGQELKKKVNELAKHT